MISRRVTPRGVGLVCLFIFPLLPVVLLVILLLPLSVGEVMSVVFVFELGIFVVRISVPAPGEEIYMGRVDRRKHARALSRFKRFFFVFAAHVSMFTLTRLLGEPINAQCNY